MDRKVILYIATSLDGYVADKNRSVEWLGGDGSDPENMGFYDKFYSKIDTVILGKTTYDQIETELSPNNWPYTGKHSYVLTNQDWGSDNADITFTNKTPEKLIEQIKEKSGKDIWICGGAFVANEFLNAGLIDIVHISVMPKILGGGVRLFNERDKTINLKLIKSENYNGITDLVYSVQK